MNTKQQKQAQAKSLISQLTAKGYEVLYGGSKGHGFWIKGKINSRTKTTWHSFKESSALVA